MKTYSIIVILTFLSIGCARVKPYKYDICVHHKGEISRLTNDESFDIQDSLSGRISGEIIDHGSSSPIEFATVIIKNKSSLEIIDIYVDSLGYFSTSISTGHFDLRIESIGYSLLDTSINFDSGTIRHLKIEMGASERFTMYRIGSWNKLSYKEINQLSIDLTK